MPHIHHQNGDLFYTTYGDKTAPALILSNSLGTDHSMWSKQIKDFAEHFFVVCYDTRGHGRSKNHNQSIDIALLGKDVLSILNQLNIKKAHFCGISMGGLIGQWLALNAPEHLHKLILCNTAAKIGSKEAWLERAQLVRKQGLEKIADGSPQRWFTAEFITQQPVFIQTLIRTLKAFDKEGYANCCEAIATADFTKSIHTIQIPTLIIVGDQDPVTTITDGNLLKQSIQDTQLITLPASHISNIEASNSFNQAVIDFLTH